MQSVAITGPVKATGPGDTPSRRKILTCSPKSTGNDEVACAKKILASLALHAYRRPASAADLETLLGFYQSARNTGTFENGIQRALADNHTARVLSQMPRKIEHALTQT